MAPPTTLFEQSASENPLWTSKAEELEFYQDIAAQSGRMSFSSVGISATGLPMYLVRVGYPFAPTDEELHDKDVSLFLGCLHGDEPAGREAYFQFMRDLTFTNDQATQQYLSKHPVLFMASMNPDGIDPVRSNGSRYNGNNESLNGYWISYLQPELVAVGSVIRLAEPCIVCDIHMMPQTTPQFSVINALNLAADSTMTALSEDVKEVMQAAAVTAGFTSGDYPNNGIPVVASNSAGLRNAIGVISESPWDTSVLSCKDAVAGNLAMINSILDWHSANDATVTQAVANAKLSAVTDGASRVDPVRPVVSEIAIGYRLTSAQAAVVSDSLYSQNLSSFAIEGSTDVYIPMAQAGKRILPFLLDQDSSDRAVTAQRLTSPPALASPTPVQYNARVYDEQSGALVNARLGVDTTSFKLVGLTPETGYEFDAQEQAGGALSAWSSRQQFSTLTASPTFNLQWRDTATQTVTNVSGITDLFYELSNLNPAESYEFRVQESEGAQTSEWSDWTEFTTASIVDAFGISDVATVQDGWSALCHLSASIYNTASATDQSGDIQQSLNSFAAASTGSAIVDATSAASAALTAGAAGGESWSAHAQVLVNMLSGAAGSDEISRQTDSAITAALSEGSAASDQFLSAVNSIASFGSGSTAGDALLAIVIQLAGISSGSIASDTFNIDFGFPGAIQSGAISSDAWLILAGMSADLSDIVTADDLMAARATVSAGIVAGALASDSFAIVNSGIRYLVMGAITLRSALNFAVKIKP